MSLGLYAGTVVTDVFPRYGFIFVFDGSGMWISAFGTFYGEGWSITRCSHRVHVFALSATLLPQLLVSNKVSNSRFFVHPGMSTFVER